MANKRLFQQRGISRSVPKANTRNEAGGQAYSLPTEHALAQYVVTGTFANTYYTTAGEQLKEIEKLAQQCSSEFIAKLAVYGRKIARMKDTPAYLLAVLTARGELALLSRIFDQVCDNSKMLLNYVQIVRSGAVGRKSFGSRPKKLIQQWIKNKSPKALYLSSVGHADPSIADVIRMVRPVPESVVEQTMYWYLTGLQRSDGLYQADENALPEDIQIFEALKAGKTKQIPDLPFRVLTNVNLSESQWREIGLNMPWNTLRLNLNQLARRGAFNGRVGSFTDQVAKKLRDPDLVRKYNAFPYQLLTTCQNMKDVPTQVTNALQDAMEIATENVPELDGKTVVMIDVSGSMQGSITGWGRGGRHSVTRCVDVASLIAACVLRNNDDALVIAFDWGRAPYLPELNPRDSVMTNASKLAKYGGGGTDCSLPLRYLNAKSYKADNLIMVSDMESWASVGRRGTAYMEAWAQFRNRNRKAKLVNIDIQAYSSVQAPDRKEEILNIGGFSDVVFTVMDEFFNRKEDTNFVQIVNESVDL